MILYRPVGLKELELIARAAFRAFPLRLLVLLGNAILTTNCPSRLDCQPARLLYLTGLAYELMGNLEKASQCLWRSGKPIRPRPKR